MARRAKDVFSTYEEMKHGGITQRLWQDLANLAPEDSAWSWQDVSRRRGKVLEVMDVADFEGPSQNGS